MDLHCALLDVTIMICTKFLQVSLASKFTNLSNTLPSTQHKFSGNDTNTYQELYHLRNILVSQTEKTNFHRQERTSMKVEITLASFSEYNSGVCHTNSVDMHITNLNGRVAVFRTCILYDIFHQLFISR